MLFPPDPALPAALVTRVDRTAYDVLTAAGPDRVSALPVPPDPLEGATVGDRVTVADGAAVALLPRTSLLARAASNGRSTAQPLAANVDSVLLCIGLPAPLPLRRLERLLAVAWDSGAAPVVVLTKTDLSADLSAELRALARHAPGADVVAVSATRGDLAGLAPYVGPGQTVVLLGASGAGKSTLVNALLGQDLMPTTEVRAADGKGRHTTAHRQLVVLPSGGVVIDTPGLRGVGLAGPGGLREAFADIDALAQSCRFSDCGHAGEPGCAVRAEVDGGGLTADRVQAWRALQREAAFQARRSDVRLQAEERRRWRAVAKANRARPPRP